MFLRTSHLKKFKQALKPQQFCQESTKYEHTRAFRRSVFTLDIITTLVSCKDITVYCFQYWRIGSTLPYIKEAENVQIFSFPHSFLLCVRKNPVKA